MSPNIIVPLSKKEVVPGENVEKASVNLYDIEYPVVMIRRKYLDNIR